MLYTIILIGCFFLGSGFILTKNNARYLLAGYNTMPESERKKVNIEGLVNYFRRFHFFLGLSFTAVGLIILNLIGESAAGIFLAVYPILAYIFFIIQTRKFAEGTFSTSGKVGIYLLLIILVLIFILFGYGNKNVTMEVGKDIIVIRGMYGESLYYNDIESIEIISSLPEIKSRINGFAMGEVNKGYFRTKKGERIKLLLNSKNQPFILILKNSGEKIYLSGEDHMVEKLRKTGLNIHSDPL